MAFQGTDREARTAKTTSEHALAGRYELERCLARHGTCSVYKANDQHTGRTVAIKVLTEQIMSNEELRRFHRGALAASAVRHDNLVQILDFGTTTDDRPYMVMEFVEGETLRRIVDENGAIAPATAVDITIQILSGLSAVHEKSIVHRDLKSANVMIDRFDSQNPHAKILDFGLAKPACQLESGKPITKQGQVVGSPVYMSPEQVQGMPLDGRSDIYSTGCILFELLTNQPLFLGNTAIETMSLHVRQTPPTLSEVAPHLNLPFALESVTKRAVAKDPACRFQSAQEMKEALLQVQETLAGPSQEDTRRMKAVGRSAVPRWLLLLLATIALLCLLAGVGMLILLASGMGLPEL